MGNPEQPSRQLQCPSGECGPRVAGGQRGRGLRAPPALLLSLLLPAVVSPRFRLAQQLSQGCKAFPFLCPLPFGARLGPARPPRGRHLCPRLPGGTGSALGVPRPEPTQRGFLPCRAEHGGSQGAGQTPLFSRLSGPEPKAHRRLLQRAPGLAGRQLFAVGCWRARGLS